MPTQVVLFLLLSTDHYLDTLFVSICVFTCAFASGLLYTCYFVAGQVGDYVDIKVDAAVQKGMPHKFYHGRTGIVFNVTNSSVGVVVNKIINGRLEKKRVNVRVEHVKPSKCRVDFLARVASNERTKAESRKEGGVRRELKRSAGIPRAGAIIRGQKKNDDGEKVSVAKFLHPQAYEFIC